MWRSLLYVFMAALLVFNGMVYSVIQGSYELNKAEIIANFCVNKSRPELKCDGKCYLAQQLQAEKEKREQSSQHAFSQDFGQFVAAEPVTGLAELVVDFQRAFPNRLANPLYASFVGAIDIPPRIVA